MPDHTPGIFLKSLIGGLLIALSLGLCVGYDVQRQLDPQQGPRQLNASYQWLDGIIRSSAEPERGVFLKFDYFPGISAGFVTNIYFRAVYVLFPRPVLVADPETVVNKPLQLLQSNRYPSEHWLRQRGVGSIVIWDMNPVSGQPFVAKVKWLGRSG